MNRIRTTTRLGLSASVYIPLLTSLFAAPLIARALGVSGRGLLALIIVIDEASSALFRWGLPEAAGFYIKQGRSYRSVRSSVRRFSVWSTPLAVAVAVAVATLPSIADAGRLEQLSVFILIAWSPLMNTTSMCIRNALMAHGDFRSLRNNSIFSSLPLALAVIVASAADSLSLLVVLGATLCANVVARLHLEHRARIAFAGDLDADDRVETRELLRFGTKVVPASLSELGNSRLDQLLLAPILGLSSLGVYAVAVVVGTLPVRFGYGLAVAGFKSMPSDPTTANGAILGRATRQSIPPLVLLSVCVAVAAPFLIPLAFGNEYQRAVWPCLLIIPGALAMSVNFSVWQTANALGRPGLSSISQVVSLVATIVLLVVLMPSFGIGGAAIATSIAYSLRLAVSVMLIRRLGAGRLFPRRSDVKESFTALWRTT
jgi:O-antigen/teichoic acid export membrane protein